MFTFVTSKRPSSPVFLANGRHLVGCIFFSVWAIIGYQHFLGSYQSIKISQINISYLGLPNQSSKNHQLSSRLSNISRDDLTAAEQVLPNSNSPIITSTCLTNGTFWSPRNRATFIDAEIPDIIRFLGDLECLSGSTRYAVDIGANDGHGPSEKLFQPPFSYPGLMMEGDSKWLSSMQKVVPFASVVKLIAWITPLSISQVFYAKGVPKDFVYMKIDIDADDCATLVAIMERGFRPRVLQMEMTPEIPPPLSFGILPLVKYGYSAHAGFQSCSISMMNALAETYSYRLVSVGGTKDALFVHESVVPVFKVIDVWQSYDRFAGCCWAVPNPSNTRWLFTHQKVKLGMTPPTEWLGMARKNNTQEALFSSVLLYMRHACLVRAQKSGLKSKTCPFDFVFSSNPSQAAKEFIQTIQGRMNTSAETVKFNN